MKKKTWFLFLFLLSILLYTGRHAIVNFYYMSSFEKSSLYDRALWMKKDMLNPKVVFLGSSMTRHSIVPAVIRKNSKLKDADIVNLGMNAATPYEMYLTFMKNKSSFTKTKVFFFSLEPWIFSKKYYKYKIFEKSLWSNEEWDYYMPEKNNFRGCKTEILRKSISARYRKPKFEDYGYERLKYDNTKNLSYQIKMKFLIFSMIHYIITLLFHFFN